MISRRMKRRDWLVLLLLCGCFIASAQPRYEAELGKVTKDGFYRLVLTPEISGRSFRNWEDLRIIDQHNMQVPFFINPNQIKIGNSDTAGAQELSIPEPSFSCVDSADLTYVTIKFNAFYNLDRILFKFDGPKFFKRKASLITPWDNMPGYSIREFYLSGKTYTRFVGIKVKNLTLVIENDDNPPLKVQYVGGFQASKDLTAYLEANKTYKLTFGDSTAPAPVYDLKYFKDSIGKVIPELSVGEIKPINPPKVSSQKPLAVSGNKWIMWAILVLLLVGLSFITFNMVRKIN